MIRSKIFCRQSGLLATAPSNGNVITISIIDATSSGARCSFLAPGTNNSAWHCIISTFLFHAASACLHSTKCDTAVFVVFGVASRCIAQHPARKPSFSQTDSMAARVTAVRVARKTAARREDASVGRGRYAAPGNRRSSERQRPGLGIARTSLANICENHTRQNLEVGRCDESLPMKPRVRWGNQPHKPHAL